uniref:Histone-lysine N-methyltransferase n=1 Tax=Compsopogon caeruleus TaxID=31354 RepID=A0A7S1TJ53_9RHOD
MKVDRSRPGSVAFRLGSMTLLSLGQIVDSDLFHCLHAIFPMGYVLHRRYWSLDYPGQREGYFFEIAGDASTGPCFRIRSARTKFVFANERTVELAWNRFTCMLAASRRSLYLQTFPSSLPGRHWTLTALEAFGLQNSRICRLLEHLPGAGSCKNYQFRHLPRDELEMIDCKHEGLQLSMVDCARTKGLLPRRNVESHGSVKQALVYTPQPAEHLMETKIQLGHSKRRRSGLPIAMQYRNMLRSWKRRTEIRQSEIQGWGLFTTDAFEENEMVIEYAGELIRPSISDVREKAYERKGRGCYMFKIDEDIIVDATRRGNWARFINHSCDPNCVSRRVTVEGGRKAIVIVARRGLCCGEELSYDYMFPVEDEKVPCSCRAANCRGSLN